MLTGFPSAGRSIVRGADGLAHTVATETSTYRVDGAVAVDTRGRFDPVAGART